MSDTFYFRDLDLTVETVYLEGHRALSDIKNFDVLKTTDILATAFTLPALQPYVLRLETLQHIALAYACGHRKPTTKNVAAWLNALGSTSLAVREDPVEDVFINRIHHQQKDFLLFEGAEESAGFQLQRVLNALAQLPNHRPIEDVRKSILALLTMTDRMVRAASLELFQIGDTSPSKTLSPAQIASLSTVTRTSKFRLSDLAPEQIDVTNLTPFVFPMASANALAKQSLYPSDLCRHPILQFNDSLIIALPTSVAFAIRTLVSDICDIHGLTREYSSAYAEEIYDTFSQTPSIQLPPKYRTTFRDNNGFFVLNTTKTIDQNRLLHLCLITNAADPTHKSSPDSSLLPALISSSVRIMQTQLQARRSELDVVSLVVLAGSTRAIGMTPHQTPQLQWRTEIVSASDLYALSWEKEFDLLMLWRLLDAEDRLRELRVELLNPNGLLNLFAWMQSLDGHLVPHKQIPPNAEQSAPLVVGLPTNAFLDLRQNSARGWDEHRLKTWDDETVTVRRESATSSFKEDHLAPFYVSVDHLACDRLVGVLKTSMRFWWVEVSGNLPTTQLHYQLWHAVGIWIKKAAHILDQVLPSLPLKPLLWQCHFEEPDPIRPDTPVLDALHVENQVTTTFNEPIIETRLDGQFLRSFRVPQNIGERSLVTSLVKGAFLAANVSSDPTSINAAVDKIVPNEWARDMHLFVAQTFRDYTRESLPRKPIQVEKIDDATLRLGLGPRSQKAKLVITGKERCCAFLADVIDRIWLDLRSQLAKYSRQELLVSLLVNHEIVAIDSDRWHRTARAVFALHTDEEDVKSASVEHISRLNATALGTRILVEMAACESSTTQRKDAGRLDVARMIASCLQMHFFGGWSEAIFFDGKAPEISVSALGDIYGHSQFEQSIVTPYGQALGAERLTMGVNRYEDSFQLPDSSESPSIGLPTDFVSAWIAEFGFSIDDLRIFLQTLDDIGLQKNECVFRFSRKELVDLQFAAGLSVEVTHRILTTFVLHPRQTWASTPVGFTDKDWHPWRFRRQLSLVRRPIVQIDDSEPVEFLIAPGMIRESIAKVLDYCLNGGYEAKAFKSQSMRSWVGSAENERGHRLNNTVADALGAIGWRTWPNIKLTSILNMSLAIDYGDIDVLAFKNGRVVAIECKDLELAMTAGDIARQLSQFRGEVDSHGRRDRLRKHTDRIEVIDSNRQSLLKFLRTTKIESLESCMVFNRVVPMQFSNAISATGMRLLSLADLKSL